MHNDIHKLDNYDSPPPANIPAERSLLAAAIVLPTDRQRQLINQLRPIDFSLPEHGMVLLALKAILNRGEPIDAITLRSELIKRGICEQVGGAAFLAEIMLGMPDADQGAPVWAAEVIKKAQCRYVWQECRGAAVDAWEAKANPLEIVYRLRDKLDTIIRKSRSTSDRGGGGGEVIKMINDEISGKRKSVPMTLDCLSRYVRPFTPGSICLLVGAAGGGKSFLLSENLNKFFFDQVPASCLMLEKNRAWHLRRSLALLVNDLRILNDEYILENPQYYAEKAEDFEGELDEIGRMLWDSSMIGSSLDEIAIWVDQQAAAGSRIIIIDPLSLTDANDKPYESDDRFMRSVRKSIERTGASLWITTHPRAGYKNGPLTLDDLAGGRVLVRRADSIIHLKSNEPERASFIKDLTNHEIDYDADFNRTIRVLKSREGQAVGKDFGCYFLASGHLQELGIVAVNGSEIADHQVAKNQSVRSIRK